jgi:hypothetical protein
MAAGLKQDVVIREQGSSGGGGSKKRYKQKGAHHAFDWETLDNPDVQVEIDWENEKEEHWS